MKRETRNVLLLAHRGARLYAPENTVAAFELALAHGCDGFEFDVRCSSDGRAILCHDPRLAGRRVSAHTFDELRKLCPTLVTLEEVLERFGTRAYLYIELKTGGMEDVVLSALKAHPPGRGYVVASFLPEVLQAVNSRELRVPLGLICDKENMLQQWRSLPVSVVMPNHRLANKAVVDELHAESKRVYVWTVNQSREMKSLAAMGLDGILSDDTELLVRTLKSE